MMCRLAVRVLQFGAIAVVLAASPTRAFDLDRFLVPKELVLHASAVLAALFALGVLRRATFTTVDRLLLAFLGLSAVSALFAVNPWLAMRAVAVSASGILLYWIAREVREPDRLIHGLALAVVLAAATSLLQTYGVWLDVFSPNRAPGGTLGNRNFVAHAAAFGLPVVLAAVLRARRPLFPAIGSAVVLAALVLTRSRAAWLAFGAVAAVFLYLLIVRREKRLALVALFAAGGVTAALLIPNTLRWRSDNPYVETATSVVNYQEGSGRGRLIQYERSLQMALSSPLFGVGPGNWPVEYPEHAARRDPSLDPNEPGTTYNPWPSSDWVAFVSERGVIATLLLAAALLLILKRSRDAIVFATLAAAGIAGAFDAVLLLPLPAFLVWTALGALTSARVEPAVPGTVVAEAPGAAPVVDSAPRPARRQFAPALVVVVLIVVSVAGAARSAAQLVGMELFVAGDVRRAVAIDPGNYRARLRLARSGRDRCEHALAARALFPHADAAKAAARRCD